MLKEVDTSIKGFEKLGIKLTQEQYNDLWDCNFQIMQSVTSKESNLYASPMLPIMELLKKWNMLPKEMICEPSNDNPTDNSTYNSD